jgi:hypothetical protein
MAHPDDFDVFVSYSHDDREEVHPIIKKLEAAQFSVWWDEKIPVGSRWRHELSQRLVHAKSVCVFWSTKSIKRDFVCDEAQNALERGILVPVLLDDTKPPLGFGEIQFASLANPATADKEMERIISSIRQLSKAGFDVSLSRAVDIEGGMTRDGAKEADLFLQEVRARSDVLRRNPGAERALREAIRGVRQTYEAVIDAIDRFLSPLTKKVQIELGLYLPFASGRMIQETERRRGHCRLIAQIYSESGGLRESLPRTVTDEAIYALNELMSQIEYADIDLFEAMTDVGHALANEGAVITNLLLAQQPQAAEAHLRQCASKLIPLQQELAQGMGRVDKLIVDLGIDIS